MIHHGASFCFKLILIWTDIQIVMLNVRASREGATSAYEEER